MHRVVTRHKDQYGKMVSEAGPWHPTREEAERWALTLRQLGYHATLESMPNGHAGNDEDRELADALANLA